MHDFLKLEKIEYGGIKGNQLSQVTEGIFNEFQEHFKTFTESTYNPLDLEDDVRRHAIIYFKDKQISTQVEMVKHLSLLSSSRS